MVFVLCRSKRLLREAPLAEIRRMNGVLWWRNIGRFVFIKDVHAYVRLRNNKRADQRKSRVVAIK